MPEPRPEAKAPADPPPAPAAAPQSDPGRGWKPPKDTERPSKLAEEVAVMHGDLNQLKEHDVPLLRKRYGKLKRRVRRLEQPDTPVTAPSPPPVPETDDSEPTAAIQQPTDTGIEDLRNRIADLERDEKIVASGAIETTPEKKHRIIALVIGLGVFLLFWLIVFGLAHPVAGFFLGLAIGVGAAGIYIALTANSEFRATVAVKKFKGYKGDKATKTAGDNAKKS